MDVFGVGSLTDVTGVRVGHHHRLGRGWQTGTTVVFAPEGAVAAVDVRGGGPGTRETDALDARNLVDRIHAVCLTGGSAYGLAAADGVMRVLEQRSLGVRVGPARNHVVPVVPTAVIFDLGRGGRFDHRPTPEFGAAALRRARAADVARGSVGAGAGARAGGLQGGVGMASATVSLGNLTATVAALAVVNASGSPIDVASGLPWVTSRTLRRPATDERAALQAYLQASLAAIEPEGQQHQPPPLNTTIGVVATDVELTRAETGRMAQSAHDGLARAVRPSHGLFDGDTIFGLATGARPLPAPGDPATLRSAGDRAVFLDQVHATAADVFATACADAVLSATTVGALLAYGDLCPSTFRGVG